MMMKNLVHRNNMRFSLVKLLVIASFPRTIVTGVLATSTDSSGAFRGHGLSTVGESASRSDPKIYRTLQVQIVHRHGDRTPITPLKNENFWADQLASNSTLDEVAKNTHQIRSTQVNTHSANGRGPFGKLTELGLLQMIKLGSKLREDLSASDADYKVNNDNGDIVHPAVWTPERPLKPSNLRVISTDFARTIQSVQGVLVGLFPDGTNNESIAIDTRHTSWMIPDPSPRRSREQERLEQELVLRPHLLAKERDMIPLAVRATKSIHHLLANDAREADFGIQQEHPEDISIEIEPLAWNQLAEVTTCLSVRGLLPDGITPQDCESINKHAAWRSFESLRHPRLGYLAMGKMATQQVDYLLQHTHDREPPVTIWSAHDSTLIGLMCVYRLEQPAAWPEYGSYMMIELLEVTLGKKKDHVVRFSLNGETLRANWDGELMDHVPLKYLAEKIRSQARVAASS